MNKIIYFDIDRTLIDIDTWYLRNKIKIEEMFVKEFEIDADLGYKAYYNEIKSRSSNSKSNWNNSILNLSKTLNLDFAKLDRSIKEILENENYQSLVFPNVEEYLAKLKALDYRLGIFSEGDSWFQNLKLIKSRLLKYFDKTLIHYFENKLENANVLVSNSVVFDDSEEKLKELNKLRLDIKTIMVNKDKGLSTFSINQILELINEK
jgi:FMN phosphatase YigB (HAD superfamily)